jgi:sulfur relay (sulfurtransferase) complex TusBCD TusD component (DsrE family)
MAKYTLIASRDPFESKESEHYLSLAGDLKKAGNEVTVFLVQNGVFAARPGAHGKRLSALAGDGVTVLADSFSLKERGINAQRLADKVKASELDIVVDHLADGRKVVWH